MKKTNSIPRFLGCALATALAACALLAGTAAPAAAQAGAKAAELPAAGYGPRRGPLTPDEQAMARRAWLYFENNFQPSTGLVNAVDNYPSTTMWDTASYLGALLSARELGLIDRATYERRLQPLLATLAKLDLFRGELPNKVYNTQTAAKTDYGNKPGEIGFSAIDLGRLLIWLKITKERYPEHADAVDRVVLAWDFRRVVDRHGTMFGAMLDKDGRTLYVQEGRLGYEEYAAKGFQLWGFDTTRASRPEPFGTLDVFGVQLPYDTRDPRIYHQHNYVVAESYVLDAIELNWDHPLDRDTDERRHSMCWMADFAHRVYQAQENRHKATGILTARSEHQLEKEPYFVYDTVYSDGYAWNTITDSGRHVPEAAAVALKAALGMWVLWKSPYTDLLYQAIAPAHDPKKGYFEGLYENGSGPIRTQTANNNGIMLATLAFKAQGKLLKWGGPAEGGLWESVGADPKADDDRGRPRFVRKTEPAAREASRWPRRLGMPTGEAGQADAAAPALRPTAARSTATCGSCPSCDTAAFDYSPAWRSLPR